jgi:hypothetical protein
MKYIDVIWLSADPNDPVRLVSELDGDRFETRKLEYFRDGVVGFADAATAANGCALGVVPVPSLEEINGDGQFQAVAISGAEFERQWEARLRPNHTFQRTPSAPLT